MTTERKAKGSRRSEHDWRSLLSRHQSSGRGVEAFCRDEQISAASFYRWRSILRDGRDRDASGCHRSHAARVEDEVRPRSHEIRHRARGSITAWFGRLLSRAVLQGLLFLQAAPTVTADACMLFMGARPCLVRGAPQRFGVSTLRAPHRLPG